MTIQIYQVDAFTNKLFSGNPAAVCPLDYWLPDESMQQIAMENNLAETAFYVKLDNHYEIRWFTPAVEVDLCGHATLAAAYVLFNHENYRNDVIRFYSGRSGDLTVTKDGDFLSLNFPTDVLIPTDLTAEMRHCFDLKPTSVIKGKTDLLFVFENESDVVNIQPDFDRISKLDCRGVIISAKGPTVDFVSRFFAPQVGIKEDPVTGSAFTTLTPYWAKQLGKTEFTAIQLSERKGHVKCKYLNERVEISGEGRLYMKGEVWVECGN